jgi:hypothetical protein
MHEQSKFMQSAGRSSPSCWVGRECDTPTHPAGCQLAAGLLLHPARTIGCTDMPEFQAQPGRRPQGELLFCFALSLRRCRGRPRGFSSPPTCAFGAAVAPVAVSKEDGVQRCVSVFAFPTQATLPSVWEGLSPARAHRLCRARREAQTPAARAARTLVLARDVNAGCWRVGQVDLVLM